MSYILDALRRAESERANEKVPGLYDQSADPLLSPYRPRSHSLWLWMLACATTVLAAVLAWLILRPSSPAPQAPVVPVPAPAAPAPVAAVPTAPVRTQTAVPQFRPAGAPALISIAPTGSPAPAAASPAPQPPASNPAPAPVAAAAPASAGEERAPGQGELPEDIRRALPALHFDGTVYSSRASSRILMVNGQLLHEGDNLAADLSIERIGPKSAVLNFRGHRFELSR